LPNVNVSQSAVLANEVPVVVNPRNPLQILSGANDYNCPNIQGFYASSDGGTTWTRTCLNSIAGDFGEGDPGVGYDLHNTAYISGIDANSGIVFEKSTNNGVTWSAPAVAVKPFFSGGLADKPWLQIDTYPASPHANALYISVTQFDSSSNSQITVAHSNDGGGTGKVARKPIHGAEKIARFYASVRRTGNMPPPATGNSVAAMLGNRCCAETFTLSIPPARPSARCTNRESARRSSARRRRTC